MNLCKTCVPFVILLLASYVNTQNKAIVAGTAAASGAAVGYYVVVVTGMTTASMECEGGVVALAAAGPIVVGIGAVVGLAAFGVYQVFQP